MNRNIALKECRRLERLRKLPLYRYSHTSTNSRSLSTTCSRLQFNNSNQSKKDGFTHFGFETVAENLKQSKVASVFSSVASSYDTMNDLMSLGIHRLWKDHFVQSIDPGVNPLIQSKQEGLNILDVAGGTGDVAFRLLDYCSKVHNDSTTKVTVADINPEMLAEGKKRSIQSPYARSGQLEFIKANAESLTMIQDNSLDLYTVAFGIRNFTNIPAALKEAHRVLKPGGVFACLEFSKVDNEAFNWFYKRWSFSAIPIIGEVVAGDRSSYQYLVESIERFPDQNTFANMIQAAGFELPHDVGEVSGSWENLSGGIACIHKGIKLTV